MPFDQDNPDFPHEDINLASFPQDEAELTGVRLATARRLASELAAEFVHLSFADQKLLIREMFPRYMLEWTYVYGPEPEIVVPMDYNLD